MISKFVHISSVRNFICLNSCSISIVNRYSHLHGKTYSKLSTKSNCSQLKYAAPIWNPYHKLQFQHVEKVQMTAARWTCRRWRNKSSLGNILAIPGGPQGEVLLNLLLKDSLETDKYLTLASNLRRTRASHDSQ